MLYRTSLLSPCQIEEPQKQSEQLLEVKAFSWSYEHILYRNVIKEIAKEYVLWSYYASCPQAIILPWSYEFILFEEMDLLIRKRNM